MAEVSDRPAIVQRGSATSIPIPDKSLDAVISDPPYYDNVPYADISDFFYVWLKRSVGHFYPEHFATETTPKKAKQSPTPPVTVEIKTKQNRRMKP